MITKKEFETVYRKFPPSKCELFYIKNFSISSLHQNSYAAVIILFGLCLPFIFAVVAHFLSWPKELTYIPSFIYAGLLAAIGIFSFVLWHKKVGRINKICKELGISKECYNKVVHEYYYQNYYPDIKDYIQSLAK